MKISNRWLGSLALSLCLGLSGLGVSAADSEKAVYHIDNAAVQATKALRNIRNHLDTAPSTKIVVVTHAEGVDFLFDDAKDPKNPNVD